MHKEINSDIMRDVRISGLLLRDTREVLYCFDEPVPEFLDERGRLATNYSDLFRDLSFLLIGCWGKSILHKYMLLLKPGEKREVFRRVRVAELPYYYKTEHFERDGWEMKEVTIV